MQFFKRAFSLTKSVPGGTGAPTLRPRALRKKTFAELEALGFQPANSLPLPDVGQGVRSPREIATRLMALQALFTWVVIPETAAATDQVKSYIDRNGLCEALTDEEVGILEHPRAEAYDLHERNIGWKLENMWALAWVLGFEPEPGFDASQIQDDVIHAIFFEFLPDLDGTVDELLSKSNLRSAEQVITMEYRFYCAHNAVRSAQFGENTVPAGFDPFQHGGAVHERRHALTWCLSPNVSWDDTDLST